MNKQGYTIIDKWQVGDDDYALIDRGAGVYDRWVVAHWVDYSNPEKITWGAGHYFEEKDEAQWEMLKRYEKALIEEAHQARRMRKQIEEEWDKAAQAPYENKPCDNSGYCAGTGCKQFWICNGGN